MAEKRRCLCYIKQANLSYTVSKSNYLDQKEVALLWRLLGDEEINCKFGKEKRVEDKNIENIGGENAKSSPAESFI